MEVIERYAPSWPEEVRDLRVARRIGRVAHIDPVPEVLEEGQAVETSRPDEPLMLRGILPGLKELYSQHLAIRGKEHINIANKLKDAGDDIRRLFDKYRREGVYGLEIDTGDAGLRTRPLAEGRDTYYLGDELVPKPLPRHRRMPVTFAEMRRSPVEDRPQVEEAHYYLLDQLYLGNLKDGVISILELGRLLNQGGDLHRVTL